MHSTNLKLKERVKELKCLYELSRIALENEKNVRTILSKTIKILPPAMQFPDFAEASITIGRDVYATPNFSRSTFKFSSAMTLSQKQKGKVEIGYRSTVKTKGVGGPFLVEEKKLINTVARELSLLINRSIAEEEKQKLQSQLKQLERLAFVGELSAGIAHELNEPLGRILGFAQLIKKAGGLNGQQEEDIDRIVKASLYTREIIKKLMLFSRQMPQQITMVNLNEIISNTLYFIDVRFQSGRIKMISKLDPRLPSIQADAVQMSQVLVNLTTNAIHAMPRGGELWIATKVKKDSISLTVKDTGQGMTNEVKKKIFEPFFTTKPVGEGTGLGLSVVQGIVSSHQGKISVTSTVGKGSKFEVLLPIRQNRKK
ncbi:ATP-binding protein [Chryseolinea sp. H1M3-3]|uniref:sensor histidine kinase n=1 Tax=Chryseolinea sp. H1M3-3 TaxID=3034144 RepID=UPI0023EBE1F0|nr:ATP-binding protein [Chryseolinea sp. H1M3-3]